MAHPACDTRGLHCDFPLPLQLLYDPSLYRYLSPLLSWQRAATAAAALLVTAQLVWLLAWWRGRR